MAIWALAEGPEVYVLPLKSLRIIGLSRTWSFLRALLWHIMLARALACP